MKSLNPVAGILILAVTLSLLGAGCGVVGVGQTETVITRGLAKPGAAPSGSGILPRNPGGLGTAPIGGFAPGASNPKGMPPGYAPPKPPEPPELPESTPSRG